MKQLVAILMFLGLVSAWGQRPIGDTLRGLDDSYYYYIYADYIRMEYMNIQTDCNLIYMYGRVSDWSASAEPGDEWTTMTNTYSSGNGLTAVQMYTNKPLKVLGLSAVAYRDLPKQTNEGFLIGGLRFNTRDTTLAGRITDSLIIYQKDDKNLVRLKSAPWRIEYPHRYLYAPYGYLRLHARVASLPLDMFDTNVIAPLYEAMFDRPVVVEDSFVVAGTMLNNGLGWLQYSEGAGNFAWLWYRTATRYVGIPITWGELNGNIIDTNIMVGAKLRSLDWRWYKGTGDYQRWITPDGHVTDTFNRSGRTVPMIFPIIDPDFDTVICHDVKHLRVEERGAGCATIVWDNGDGGPWEVAIGKSTDRWEDFVITSTAVPTLTVSGLEVGIQYFAVVRGYCSVTDEFGSWSSPIEVEVYRPAEPEDPEEGIALAEEADRYVSVVPNPAEKEATVLSAYRMQRIAVYDSRGTKMLERKADGFSTTIDVSAWARGVYVVAVYSGQELRTQRLVVR